MNQSKISVLVLLAALGTPAPARASLAPATGSAPPAPIRVEIPQSAVHLDLPGPAASPASSGRFELGASTWAPSNLALQSRVAGTSAFGRRGLPTLSGAILLSPWELRAGDLSFRAGLSLASLSRSGPAPALAGGGIETQNLYLLPFTAGLELTPAATRWRSAALHAAAGVSPTLLFSGRSVFDDGVTAFGIPLTFSAGAETDLRWLLRASDLRLTLDLMTTVGRIDGGSLNGTGLSAGIRVPM